MVLITTLPPYYDGLPEYSTRTNYITYSNINTLEVELYSPPRYEIIFPQYIINQPILDEDEIHVINTPPRIIRQLDTILPTTNNIPLMKQLYPSKCIKCCKDIYNLCCCYSGCYKKNSFDVRCCGICYLLCPLTKDNYNFVDSEQCECCPSNVTIYCDSPYIVTYDLSVNCTWFCIPLKLPVTSPCLLGSLFNQCVNYVRNTHHNYLF